MLIISPEILEDGTLNNMDRQQGYTDNLLLIPGYYCVGVNMHAKVRDAIKGVPKIVTWDQSLLTVELTL